MNKKSMPTAVAGSLMFMGLTVLFLTLGGLTQLLNIYFGIFFTEAIILGLVTYLVCVFKKYYVKESLALRMPYEGTLWKAFFISLLSYPVIVFINGLYLTGLSKFMTLPSDLGVPLPETFPMFLVSVIMFAVLPGIFEELVFRGFLFRAFDRYKPVARIFITATLFAIFHYNPINIVGPFLMGLTFGYLRYRSDSLLPSIIGHTTNNSIAMVIGYIANQAGNLDLDAAGDPDMANVEAMLGDSKVLVASFGLIVIALLAYMVYKLLKSFPDYREKTTLVIKPEKNERLFTWIMFIFGFIMLASAFVIVMKKF